MAVDFESDIIESVKVMKDGGLILYPTDTIWGIGCDATNTEAVKKVFDVKQRDDSKSLIILLADDGQLQQYVREVPDVAWDIIDLSDKPTTIVYSGAYNLPSELIAEDGTIGIRITKDPFCQRLIRKLNKPLVSTSANISGEPSPLFFDEISDDIKKGVDYIVRHRQSEHVPNTPSSIIKLSPGGIVKVLRK